MFITDTVAGGGRATPITCMGINAAGTQLHRPLGRPGHRHRRHHHDRCRDADITTGTIGGWIKIERQNAADNTWHDITVEMLNYGIGDVNDGGATCGDPTSTLNVSSTTRP